MSGPVFASTLAVAERLGRVEAAGEYRAIRWPHNPWYWGGNTLVLGCPPATGDRDRVEQAFARWFPDAPHTSFLWSGDGTPTWDGYDVQPSLGMVAEAPIAHPPLSGVDAVCLGPDDGPAWRAVEATRREVLELPEGTRFLPRSIDDARIVAAAPWGAWVALREGEVVADLGLVETPRGIRLQEVQVRGDCRGRGLGRALLGAAVRVAAGRWPGRPLLLEVDTDNDAALALYRATGFREVERLGSAQRPPVGGSG